MQFKVLKLTANGNLLLEGGIEALEGKVPFYYKKKKAGHVFDTIGRVEKPLYLGKAKNPVELIGKTVEVDV